MSLKPVDLESKSFVNKADAQERQSNAGGCPFDKVHSPLINPYKKIAVI
jgi:hypothetical protein